MPGVAVERRYGVVLDALAVRVPVRSLARVAAARRASPRVYPVAIYHAADRHRAGARGRRAAVGRRPLDRGPGHQGRRDRRRHRRGRAVPRGRRPAARRAGFPRGQRRFTSGRVIVARSFAGKDAPGRRSPRLRSATSPSTARTSRASSPAPTARSRVRGSGCPSCTGSPAWRRAPGSATTAGSRAAITRAARSARRSSSRPPSTRRSPTAWTCSTSRSAARRSIPPPTRSSMALANAARAGVPSVVAAGNDFDSRGYGSISSPGHERDGDHGGGDVEHARLRRQRPRQRRGARRRSTPFTAVPSIGPRVPAALTASDAPRRWPRPTGSTGARCSEPARRRALRAVVIVAARRLQLRHQGDQRARGGSAGRDRRERPARPAVRRRGGGRPAAARGHRRRGRRAARLHRAAPAAARACASRARSPSCRRRRAC